MDYIQLLIGVFVLLLLFFFIEPIITRRSLKAKNILLTGGVLLILNTVFWVGTYIKAQALADLITSQCGSEVSALSIVYFEQEAADILGYCMTGTDP